MHIEALNAITRERARIREAVVNLSRVELDIDSLDLAPYEKGGGVDYVRLGEVLAILTENILKEGEKVTED